MVLDDRTTEVPTVLILNIGGIRRVEKRPRIEDLVPQILVCLAVIVVRSALRAEVDDASGKLSPFRPQVVVLHLKFRDRVHVRNQNWQVDISDVYRLAVNIFCALVTKRAAHLVVAPAEWVLAHLRAPRAALGNRRG